jgi:hypothetical protein
MSLSYLRAGGHKQEVTHIWESRRFESMYILQGKPDQHATCIPHSVCVWSQTIYFSRGQCIATFHVVINRFEQNHCPWEEGLPTQPTPRQLTRPWVRTQLLSHNSQWGSGEKPTFYDNRLLGLPGSYLWHAIGTFNTCSRGQPIGP